jgi:hypothetical protein
VQARLVEMTRAMADSLTGELVAVSVSKEPILYGKGHYHRYPERSSLPAEFCASAEGVCDCGKLWTSAVRFRPQVIRICVVSLHYAPRGRTPLTPPGQPIGHCRLRHRARRSARPSSTARRGSVGLRFTLCAAPAARSAMWPSDLTAVSSPRARLPCFRPAPRHG